jgi:hypothetical protein
MSSVGKEIIRRLKSFTEELEKTQNLAARFTCRTVRLDLEPRRYDADLVKKTRCTLQARQRNTSTRSSWPRIEHG